MSTSSPAASTAWVSEPEALSALLFELSRRQYAFTAITPLSHHRVLARQHPAQNLRDVFGWNRAFARELLPADLFATMHHAGLLAPERALWRSRVRVASLDSVLYLHSAYPTLDPDVVFFGPDSYRFARAIRQHLRRAPGPIRRAVDIGCGAGVGGMAVASHADCGEVALVDINDTALLYSSINAAAAGLRNVSVHNSNLLNDLPGAFDLIVANPPYLNDALGRTYRNGGGSLGSALSLQIARCATTRLAPGGTLLLYTGAPIVEGHDPLLAAISEAFAGTDLTWDYDEVDPDVFGEELETPAYAQAERIAAVVLTARRPGGY